MIKNRLIPILAISMAYNNARGSPGTEAGQGANLITGHAALCLGRVLALFCLFKCCNEILSHFLRT